MLRWAANLDQVGVPGILRDSQVVVALILEVGVSIHGKLGLTAPFLQYLLRRAPEDMSCKFSQQVDQPTQWANKVWQRTILGSPHESSRHCSLVARGNVKIAEPQAVFMDMCNNIKNVKTGS